MPRNRPRPLLAGLLLGLAGFSPLVSSLLRLEAAPVSLGVPAAVPALSSGDLYRIPHTGARHD